MATKSILKDVRFRDKSLCRGFATALEHAKGKKSKEVRISRTCQRSEYPERARSFLKIWLKNFLWISNDSL